MNFMKQPLVLKLITVSLCFAAPTIVCAAKKDKKIKAEELTFDPDKYPLKRVDGMIIDVKLMSATNEKVSFISLKNNRTYSMDMVLLDEKVRKDIKKWLKSGGRQSTSFAIDFEANKEVKSTYRGSEDKFTTLRPTLSIKNNDARMKSKDMKVTVIMLGRPASESKQLYVYSNTNAKIGQLNPKEEKNFTLPKSKSIYDLRNYKHGYKYYGYAVLIYNGNEIIKSECSPSHLVREHGMKLTKLATGKTYTDDSLKPR